MLKSTPGTNGMTLALHVFVARSVVQYVSFHAQFIAVGSRRRNKRDQACELRERERFGFEQDYFRLQVCGLSALFHYSQM